MKRRDKIPPPSQQALYNRKVRNPWNISGRHLIPFAGENFQEVGQSGDQPGVLCIMPEEGVLKGLRCDNKQFCDFSPVLRTDFFLVSCRVGRRTLYRPPWSAVSAVISTSWLLLERHPVFSWLLRSPWRACLPARGQP